VKGSSVEKIVTQNCLTKEYLTEQGTWDPAPAKAKGFACSWDAYEYCRISDTGKDQNTKPASRN